MGRIRTGLVEPLETAPINEVHVESYYLLHTLYPVTEDSFDSATT